MIQKHVAVYVFLFWCSDLQNEGSIFIRDHSHNLRRSSNVNTDTYLTPPKIIKKHGYPAEVHIIESQDGYLLEYHRIPHGKGHNSSNNYPVLLHHGLLTSSIDWIMNGPQKSLAYLLADEGYDVWMANSRGNTYSRSHVSMTPHEKEFWDFSFHEMGMYDLPAAVDYILNKTRRKKLVYIGHSLGTTIFYAFASTRPDYGSKILFQISLAPVAQLSHSTSAFRFLAPYAKQIARHIELGAFLGYSSLTSLFSKFFCDEDMFRYNICEELFIFRIAGEDPSQFNKTLLLPMIVSHLPAGTSGKNILHCAQMMTSGSFSYYDYGIAGNIEKYHSPKPPSYNISSIEIPMKFYYGKNDILADPLDVELLYKKIPNQMGLVLIEYDKWNHVDFTWSNDIKKYLNEPLLQFIKNSTSDTEYFATAVSDF